MGESGGVTPPKFNSSPLRINGWKITFLLGWPIFRGELLNFQGVPGFHNKNGSHQAFKGQGLRPPASNPVYCIYSTMGPPKPACLKVFMVNHLVFRWPKPLFFMLLGAHGI